MGEVIRLRVASSQEAITLQSAAGSLAVEAVSPRVAFAKVEGGTRLDITDIDGTKSAILPDGATGQTGPAGETGPQGEPGPQGVGIKRVTWNNYTLTIELTNDTVYLSPILRGEPGAQGNDGATFTPSVSDGWISWTNDGGKDNPLPVYIKGPQGDQGPQGMTGLRGPGITGVELLPDYTLKIIFDGGAYDIVGPIRGPQGETGPQGDDYVLTAQDKEDIAEEVLSDIGIVAPAITKYVSGGIVSIDDGADGVPLESCVVKIEPVQGGSGDPASDNVRPISGWTGAKVRRSAVNLVDVSKDHKSYQRPGTVENGVITSHSGVAMEGVLIPIKSGITYNAGLTRISGDVSYPRFYTFSTNQISASSASELANPVRSFHQTSSMTANGSKSFTFTAQDNEAWLFIGMYKASTGAVFSISNIYANVVGVSEYTPYSGGTYDITFPEGTVYGGSLDVTNGTLTVSRGNIASYNGETLPGEWISDRDVYAAGTSPTTGAQVVYELAEPVVYSLTPTEITTLLGINNVLADCGDVRVEYFVDTKAYINHKLDKDQGIENAGKALLVGPDGIVAPCDVCIVETVSGTDPVIAGAADHRYMCGTVDTLTLTPPASGIVDVVFTSGTTPTVLSVPNTVKWPGWFDPSSLDASTTYEINIMDGVYGAVAAWT